MDPERYQRVQDLFWEAEEIQPAQWRDFLADRCGDDTALINEVVSLLREHNPEAALAEGNEVKPISLPSSESHTLSADSDSSDTSVVNHKSDRADRQSARLSEPTRKASQRTHAAPRDGIAGVQQPTSPTPVSQRQIPSSVASAGGDRSRWNWVWVWLCLWFSGTASIWIAAWYVGRTVIYADAEISRQLLPTTLDRAKFELLLLCNRERELCEKLAAGQARNLIRSINAKNKQVDEGIEVEKVKESAYELISRIPYVRNSLFETVIWDKDLRCVGASKGLAESRSPGLVSEDRTMQLSSMLRSCLAGNRQFWNGAPDLDRALAGEDFGANQFGWMVPIYENESKPATPIGVVLLVRNQSWDRTQMNLDRLAKANEVDVYLIDHQGVMRSESYRARQFVGLAPYGRLDEVIDGQEPIEEQEVSEQHSGHSIQIAGRFRVAEYEGVAPDFGNRGANANGVVPPLTFPADGVAQLKDRATVVRHFRRLTPYSNYAGVLCRGVWCWVPQFRLGMVVERPVNHPAVLSAGNPFGAIVNPLSISWRDAIFFSFIAVPIISLLTFWQQRALHRSELRNRPLSRYSIQDELGSGGMGLVFRAKHLELGRDIAIKFLRDDCQEGDDQHRFDREARLAAMLSCPHSVTIFDYGRTVEGDAFCVMELLEGITLYEVVARSGPQPPARVVWIIQQICQSMLEAHASGLMHRDLKPQNIMLRFDPTVGDYAVVFDFGLAKSIEPDQGMFQTAETIWAGTPMYMAPERFREPSVLDPRSDLYSIGCIAYYLLSGCPPFAECDPESMFGLIMSQLPVAIETHRNESIEPLLDEWVSQCMAKDKRQRLESVAELIETLQPISDVLPWTRNDAREWWDANYAE